MKRWFRDSAFRGLVKNGSYLAASRGVAGLIGLGVLSLATHSLGTAGFGLLVLIHAYVSAASGIAKFQSWQVVIRYGAPALRQDDIAQLQHGISFAMGLDIVSGLAGMVAAMALLPIAGSWFHIGNELLPLALIYCTLLPTMAAATPTGILRLFDRFDILSVQATVTPLLRLTLGLIAWYWSLGFTAFVAIWYVSDLLGDLVLWVLSFRELHRRNMLRGLRFGFRRHARHLTGAWKFALTTNLTTSLSAGWGPVANLLVGALLGPVAAGQYKVAQGLVDAAQKPADMLSKAFYPEVMRMDLSTKEPWRLLLRGAALSGSLGLIFVIIALVGGRPFIAVAFGQGFAPAYPLLVLMVFGMWVTMIGFPLGPMCYAVHRAGIPLRARLVATILYLLAIVPFTRLWGLNGAGAAYVMCMTLLALQMVPPLAGEYNRRQAHAI